jgi:hypothetical protein
MFSCFCNFLKNFKWNFGVAEYKYMRTSALQQPHKQATKKTQLTRQFIGNVWPFVGVKLVFHIRHFFEEKFEYFKVICDMKQNPNAGCVYTFLFGGLCLACRLYVTHLC